MKRPFFLVTLTIILAGLVLFGLSGTSISIANTGVLNNEVADSGANSSASAVITIRMYTVASQ